MDMFSSGITAEALMLKELKFLIDYLDRHSHTDKKSINKMVVEDNIFQYKSPKASLRRLSPLYKRYVCLTPELKRIVTHGSLENSTLISLYAIYKTNALFREFFNNVVLSKFQSRDYSLLNKDVYRFLNEIESEHKEVGSWKDNTREKIVQVITKILKESMILSSEKTLQKKAITKTVKDLVCNDGGKSFIKIIEVK